MERAAPFIDGEYYHLYSRGVAKQPVFLQDFDYERFQLLLYLCNSNEPVHIANILKKYQGEPLIKVLEDEDRGDALVHIVAYALMPNHVHILAREIHPGGISKLMLKVMTAYSMYFNTKNERSGPVFTRPFRSQHVENDDQLKYVFAYVLLNSLELFDPLWKERGESASGQFASYRYSSYMDYYGKTRSESKILTKDALPFEDLPALDSLLAALSADPQSHIRG